MINKKWIVAVALGLAAGLTHFWYVDTLQAEAQGGRPVEVLVFAAPLTKGSVVEKEHLASRVMPDGYVDERVARKDRLGDVVGLEVALDLRSGQTVQWTDFVERLDPNANNLAALIGSGERAMTISVDSSLSISGLLRPGHRVDILCTFVKGSRLSGERVTVTLLQNKQVLATGRHLGAQAPANGKHRFNTVTLAVTIEEAELLSLATTQGDLSVVLRGESDLAIVEGIPEKKTSDILSSHKKLKNKPAGTVKSAIERLREK